MDRTAHRLRPRTLLLARALTRQSGREFGLAGLHRGAVPTSDVGNNFLLVSARLLEHLLDIRHAAARILFHMFYLYRIICIFIRM